MQAMRKKLPPPENTLSQPGPSQCSQQQDYLAPEDYVAQDEIFKVQPCLLVIFAMLRNWPRSRDSLPFGQTAGLRHISMCLWQRVLQAQPWNRPSLCALRLLRQ